MRDVSADLELVVRDGIRRGVFPDAEAIAWRRGIAQGSFGTAGDRFFDIASLTKPFTATITARLVAKGVLGLDDPLGDATVRQVLAHRSGLPGWTPYYKSLRGDDVLRAARAETPEAPPGSREVYSDVGYLLLGALLSERSGHSLDALLAREVTGPLQIDDVRYGPIPSELALPTELCTWRGRLVQGEVHDENAAAYGKPAGHAGLFGRARGVLALGQAYLDALANRSQYLDAALARELVTAVPGGSHALAWDTRSAGASSAGSRLGPRSFGHLGFTGTSIWCDPDAEAVIVLLSNRVHPTRENQAIRDFRPALHDAVAAMLGI